MFRSSRMFRLPENGTGTIVSICAGRGERIATKSPIAIASATSWVTRRLVTSKVLSSSLTSSCIPIRVGSSTAENGSSSRRRAGEGASAWRTPTLRRIPPDSSRGCRSAVSLSPTSDNNRSAWSSLNSSDCMDLERLVPLNNPESPTPRWNRRCRLIFFLTVIHGSKTSSWNTIATGSLPIGAGLHHIDPLEGSLSPATSLKRVDLPQPLGPMTLTVAPWGTIRSTPRSASHALG